MVLLRLLADVLFYITFGLVIYWFFTDDIRALVMALVCGIISALLFWATTDIRRTQRHRRADIWDWFNLIDIIEIPLYVIRWLVSGIWRIFD